VNKSIGIEYFCIPETILPDPLWRESIAAIYNAAFSFSYDRKSTTYYMSDGSKVVLYRKEQTAIIYTRDLRSIWLAKESAITALDQWWKEQTKHQ